MPQLQLAATTDETDTAIMQTWILFALLTVASWGLYGVLLHAGQVGMGDPVNGRYKAFFWVGIAYFLIAVLAPAGMLVAAKASWSMPGKAIVLSLVAGAVGAIGAFGVLLAFGAKGHPAAVMSIIFAGAPIVNAFVAMSLHPPAGGWAKLDWRFLLGIALAATGGLLVSLYKPAPGGAPKPAPVENGSGNSNTGTTPR